MAYRILILVLLCSSCSIDRTIYEINQLELHALEDYRSLAPENILQITSPDEPGEPLSLCLTFLNRESEEPLIDQEVLFYHTDQSGEYRPANPGDESSARLSGTALTDSLGRMFVQTILPGDYGNSADNRHIHTTVIGASPEGYDIHFKQYTGRMGNRFIGKSNQHFLADLKTSEDSDLITQLTISCKFKK